MSQRPPMMRLPPRITFYTQNRLYEGAGHVSKPAVYAGIGITMAVAAVLTYWSISSGRKKEPLPGTFSEEWQKAQEEESKRRRADPIHGHKIGQKI